MADNDLLEGTMRIIERNPRDHDQLCWYYYEPEDCRTTFCFAGHAAIVAGAEQPTATMKRDGRTWFVDITDLSAADGWSEPTGPDTNLRSVQDFAAERLGLTRMQRSFLFIDATTIPELRRLVDVIKEDPNADRNRLYQALYPNIPTEETR